jgi:hypothetical protein
MALAAEHGKGHRLRFILEVNDIKGDAQRTFDYVVQNHNPKGIRVSLAFGTKGGNPPLQAADVLAYEGGKYLKEPGRKPRRAWTALDPDNTRIISYCYRKENMSELIEELSAFPENLPVSPSR